MTQVRDTGTLYLRLWVNLLKLSSQIEKQLDSQLQERFKCSLARFDLLAVLSRHTPDGILMKDIGNQLKVSGGNVTAHIKKLDATGYIQCFHKPNNRKNTYVLLTKEGIGFFQQLAEFHKLLIHDFLQNLPAEDAEMLIGQLKKVSLIFATDVHQMPESMPDNGVNGNKVTHNLS